ncbi:hypothetical protein DFH01_08110 [Falsiroseomonas bella]|uniref:Sulfotransferase family protein n=1 Tax=Falsiroseomonas bella TaxID=2184016 RepID=A0A317FNY7_9PROT|nr:sulfotransferase family 2 domain-containing protein [Falsiroseomonas bella]PWS39188.1 hypothetical protein DFH01_08110 [Falsiroseomonas bella]
MSDGAAITRQEVEYAYRLLLGRPPENERAYEYGLGAGDLETLRRWIMASPEFLLRLRDDASGAMARWVAEQQQARAAIEQQAEGPPRIVFLHIMKTAGNSLRRRLEALVPPGTVRPEQLGRPAQFPVEHFAPYRLIAGHFSAVDAAHVPGPKRVFTVLREPRERLISLYAYWSRHREEVIAERGLGQQAIARRSTLLGFLRSKAPELNGTLHNAMTTVLAGDFVYAGGGRYAHRHFPDQPKLSRAELVQRALTNLLSFDYVAFVDRLEEDRPRLMQALGLPDPGPLPRENTRELVDAMLEPAREVEVTPEAERELARLTELDRIVYRLARQHYG